MIPEMHETILILKNLAFGLGEYFSMKVIPAIVLPTFGFFFGFGSEQILLAMMFLVVMDFITGVASAKMSGQAIRSRLAVRSAFKIAVYGLLVSAGHLTEGIVPGNLFIEEAVTTFLALTELISIVENIGKLGFAVPARLLNQLQDWRDGDRRVGEETRRDETVIHNV